MPARNNIDILSIDGGGVLGILALKILIKLEEKLTLHKKGSVSDFFQLISGTSTGGIISLGLCAPDKERRPLYNSSQLLKIYTDYSQTIFPHNNSLIANFKQVFRPKYSNEGLKDVLNSYFGDLILEDSLASVLVPAFDTLSNEPFFFKKRPEKETSPFFMKDIALATSSAPTYFPPYPLTDCNKMSNYCFVDGSIFGNNPSLFALIEAMKIKIPKEEKIVYRILSLGPGFKQKKYPWYVTRKWGALSYASPFRNIPIMNMIMSGQSESSLHIQEKLPFVKIIRINPEFPGKEPELDDSSPGNIQKLLEMGEYYAEKYSPILEEFVLTSR